MALQMPKKPLLANFRKRGARPKKTDSWRDRRPGNSDAHLARIRLCPCVHCLKKPSDPHHLKYGTGERGMALRSTDRFAVPLCRAHHDEVERAGTQNEPGWFAAIGVDALALADALWHAHDVKTMTRIILAQRGTQE